jgi:hypothetical protein
MFSLKQPRRFKIFKNIWIDRWVAHDYANHSGCIATFQTWRECLDWCSKRPASC